MTLTRVQTWTAAHNISERPGYEQEPYKPVPVSGLV